MQTSEKNELGEERHRVERIGRALQRRQERPFTQEDRTEWALFKTETGSPRGLVSLEARTKLLSESLLPKAGSSVSIGSAWGRLQFRGVCVCVCRARETSLSIRKCSDNRKQLQQTPGPY